MDKTEEHSAEENKEPSAEKNERSSAEKNEEPSAEENEEPSAEENKEAASPTVDAAPARGGALAGLSLVVALLALAASGWLYYVSQFRATETEPDPSAGLREELGAHIRQAGQAAVEERRQLDEFTADLQASLQQELRLLRSANEEQFNSLQAALTSQRRRLLEYTTTDRSDWMLAEGEYLLRLANQRIIMASDTASAIALLGSADSILLELDAPELYPVRAVIARDLAALRAVPRVDVEGTWLRLQALIGEIDRLVLFELPGAPNDPAPVAADSWEQRLQQGFSAALGKVSNYVLVTTRDAPYRPALSPQWEGMVRQNLRMLLEQARAALLSGNQVLYQHSLENTRRWLNEFFSLKESGVSALDAELEELLQLSVGQDYPDINGSLLALKAVINSRHMIAEDQ